MKSSKGFGTIICVIFILAASSAIAKVPDPGEGRAVGGGIRPAAAVLCRILTGRAAVGVQRAGAFEGAGVHVERASRSAAAVVRLGRAPVGADLAVKCQRGGHREPDGPAAGAAVRR